MPILGSMITPLVPTATAGAAAGAPAPGGVVYVTDVTGNRVIPVAPGASAPDDALTVGAGAGGPAGIEITRDGATAYVVDSGSDQVRPLALSSGVFGKGIAVAPDVTSTARANPQYLAISPDSTQAYVANEAADTVTPINLRTDQPGTPIPMGHGAGPVAVAFTPDGSTAFVANYQAGTVTPITVATRTVGTPITVGQSPSALAITPDGATLYVTDQASGTVTPIATADHTVGPALTVGSAGQPDGIAITPDGRTAYVANYADGTVVPVDLGGAAPVVGVPIGLGAGTAPTAVALSPDGATVYVAEFGTGALGEISTAGNQVVTTVPVGGNPLGLAVVPDRGPTAVLRVHRAPSGAASTLDATGSTAGSSPIVNYHVDFGDGTAPVDSPTPVLTHVYAASGKYVARLTVTDAAGTSTGDLYTGQATLRSAGSSATTDRHFEIQVATAGAAANVYVANYGSATVTPIATTPTILPAPAVRVRPNPTAIAIAPNGAMAYAVNSGDGTVVPIETADNSRLTPIQVGNEPTAIAITPDGRTAYVADQGSAAVSVITLATGAVATIPLPGMEPGAVAVDPSGTWLYVADAGGRIVAVRIVDQKVGVPVSTGPASRPNALAVSPDGSLLYVTEAGTGAVAAYAIGAAGLGAPVRTYALGAGSAPSAVAVTPDGQWVVVTLKGTNAVAKLDAHLVFVTGVPLGAGAAPAGVAITPDGGTAFVSESGTNKVVPLLIGPFTLQATSAVTVGNAPAGLAITPDQAPIAKLSVTPGPASTPTAFDAGASSAPSTPIARYAWDFGDGATITTSTPTTAHTYAKPGDYRASVTLTDIDGTSTRQVFTGQTVTLNGAPTAATGQTFHVFAPAPTITALAPTSGPAGTSVTIAGTWLFGATVSFGGTPAAGVQISATGTSLVVSAPAGPALNIPQTVVISTPGPNGPQTVAAASKFTYRAGGTCGVLGSLLGACDQSFVRDSAVRREGTWS
jgi:YVTN family beta-propeller protein